MGPRSAVVAAEGPDGRPVALKVIRASHDDRHRKAASEFGRLTGAKCSYVVECFGLIDSAGVLVLELLKPPELDTPASRIRAASQVCRGLSKLHELPDPLFHLDIKPANLGRRFGEKNSQHVMFDFGGAKRSSQLRSARRLEPLSPGKPLRHRAPEVNDRVPSRVGPWSDLYSVGVLLRPALERAPHPGLAELVAGLVHDDVRRRPDSAAEVADLLDRLTSEGVF